MAVEGKVIGKIFICQDPDCGAEIFASPNSKYRRFCDDCKRRKTLSQQKRRRKLDPGLTRRKRLKGMATTLEEKCKWPYRDCPNKIEPPNRNFCNYHIANSEYCYYMDLTEPGSGGVSTYKLRKRLTRKVDRVVERVAKIVKARPTTKIYNSETMGRVFFRKMVGELYPECGY